MSALWRAHAVGRSDRTQLDGSRDG